MDGGRAVCHNATMAAWLFGSPANLPTCPPPLLTFSTKETTIMQKPAPKFRPSLSFEELDAILQALELQLNSPALATTVTPYTRKAWTVIRKMHFNAKEGLVQPSHVATGRTTATTQDVLTLLGESPAAQETVKAVEVCTIEDLRTGYKNFLTFKKPFLDAGMTNELSKEEEQIISGWHNYCKENDLDPVAEATKEN